MLEREDEADKDRKMLVRQMDALSQALEDETKTKADLVRTHTHTGHKPSLTLGLHIFNVIRLYRESRLPAHFLTPNCDTNSIILVLVKVWL